MRWLVAMLQGDWGFSFASRIDVDKLILQRVPTTLFVVGSSQILALASRAPGRRLCRDAALFDLRPDRQHVRLCRLFAADLLHRAAADPDLQRQSRLAALRLSHRHIAATGWHWYWENFKQAIMPVAVLGLFQAASYTRYVRSAVLDVIRLDYVTTARSKGLNEGKVIVKHVVRNALIPVVTLVALQMPAVFGGAIVTEQIFRIPGIGSLLITIDSRQ